MDKLEKYIQDNRHEFDMQEPQEGHMDRFAQKLQAQDTQKPKVIQMKTFWQISKVASIIILVFISGLWVRDNVFSSKETVLSEISPEYKEVEYYYNTQINTRLVQIKETDVIEDKQQKELLLKELEEMDSIYTQLSQELEANPNDERVINAMISHYKLKLNVLNKILDQLYELEKNSNKNQNNHESLEI